MSGAIRGTGKKIGRIVAERFIVAVFFGALINFLLTLQCVTDIPTVAKLRQDGASLGIYLATSWNDLLSPSGVPRPAGTTHISIVDIDEASCQAVVGGDSCHFDRIGHAEVIDAALAAADKTKARLIVFDILFPSAAEAERSEAGKRLLARLDQPGPPIVAPIAFGNNALGAMTIDRANSICGRMRCGRLRFAPAYSVDRFQVARGYPLRLPVEVRGYAAGVDAPDRRIASLVLAAAQEAHMQIRTADPLPILFTIPSFASLTDPSDEDILKAQTGTYLDSVDYQHIATAEDGKSFVLPEKKGVVLIIGSSAPVTSDWHDTPLGKMAGMEVVANAIRSIEMSGVAPARRFTWSCWWFFALSWIVLLATIFGIASVDRARDRFKLTLGLPGSPRRLVIHYSALVLLAILALGFFAEVGGKVWEIIDQLRTPQSRNGDVDIIFPVLAIFFTTAVDLSHRLLAALERWTSWLLDRAGEGAARLRAML